MTKILITGGSGKLGREVVRVFQPDSKYIVLFPTHKELDITDADMLHHYIITNKPDIVLHLAAATAPPRCEKDKDWAWKTTVRATENMVDFLKTYLPKTYFILMSTPCVMEGNNEIGYDEKSIPYPNSFYGFTKVMQEWTVIKSKLKYLIIRGNFVPREKWPYPESFSDRFGTYLFSRDLAIAIKEVIDAGQTKLVHLVGDKKMSMYELSQLCPNSKDVKPITLEEYYKKNPNSCRLTKDMSLNTIMWKEYKIGFSHKED